MDQQFEALQQEIELLRQDNAALQEALRLAQLGSVDLQGYLSKFNPDAAEQGIFTLDWELRYFVLSGTLLKYYTSERDVGRQYRGVLALEGCIVEVEEPVNTKGPFVFSIDDPEGENLLRLSADKLTTAKTWIKTLHAVGLRVRGFRHLAAVSAPGYTPQQQQQQQQQGLDSQGLPGFSRSLSSFGRAISGRWSGAALGTADNSIDSDLSIRLERLPQSEPHLQPDAPQQQPDTAAAAAAAAETEDDVISLDEDDVNQLSHLTKLRHKCRLLKCRLPHKLRRQRRHTAAVGLPDSAPGAIGRSSADPVFDGSISSSAAASGAGMSAVAAAAAASAAPGFGRTQSAGHRRTMSAPIQKQQSWRWERFDAGDELPIADLSDLSDDDSSSVSSSSTRAEPPAAANAGYQQAHLDPTHPALMQQQPQRLAVDGGLDHQRQQQQQQADLHGPLEDIQEQDGEPPKRPQRISAFGEATEAAAIAAAGGVSAAVPDAAVGVGLHGPPTPPPMAAAGPSAAIRGSGLKGAGTAMGSIKPQGTAVVKPKRGPMVGYSPVHVAAKDSILTEHDRHGVWRHEGFLNLGVVVLLATNIRMIIGNLMTYGLRMRVNRAVMQSVLPLPLSWDDLVTLTAIPGSCLLFAVGALLVEWLGLRLLQAQEKLLQGLQKKGVPSAEVAKRGAAISTSQEGLLLLLNLLNAGGSLVLPCLLVLSNKSSLVPAFLLTVVAIVVSMKLATYAHCNTALRSDARTRAVQAAAGSWAIPTTSVLHPPPCGSAGSGSGSGGSWRQLRGVSGAANRMLAPAGTARLATATTHTSPGVNGSTDVSALRTSATEPNPFLAAGLSRSSSLVRRHGGGGGGLVAAAVAWPANLTFGDLAYFLAAPTLTYQLNFPRLRQRRWRLLSRWLLLAALTAIAMSFMQVQFLMPCMQSSLVPLREMNYLRFMERLLRLAVPNTAVWLAMFYLVFHLWLNILGELLMFGDRMFYKEWWNAATLADYWKLWNIPVHKWMLRTIFFPLVRRGAPRLASLLFVFFISAVMHELAVGVPLRMLRGWAFWGMMLQVPLITLTEVLRKRLKADTLGNMVFWASFCVLGQPMCLVLYYHDWLLANLGEQGWMAAAAQGEDTAVRMASGAFNSTLSSVAGSLVY